MTTFLPADCLSKNTVLKDGFIFHWIWLLFAPFLLSRERILRNFPYNDGDQLYREKKRLCGKNI